MVNKNKFKLERQKFLFNYWSTAEKYDMGFFKFFFGLIILPTIFKVNFDFKSVIDWLFVIVVAVFIIGGMIKLRYYTIKQRKIRDVVEKMNPQH